MLEQQQQQQHIKTAFEHVLGTSYNFEECVGGLEHSRSAREGATSVLQGLMQTARITLLSGEEEGGALTQHCIKSHPT
jgi:hypothetical protein